MKGDTQKFLFFFLVQQQCTAKLLVVRTAKFKLKIFYPRVENYFYPWAENLSLHYDERGNIKVFLIFIVHQKCTVKLVVIGNAGMKIKKFCCTAENFSLPMVENIS